MKKVSLIQLARTVRKIASDRPDVKYMAQGNCMYDTGACSDGSVGCIFGQAINQLGLKVPHNFEGCSINMVLEEINTVKYSDQTKKMQWLDIVQASQDVGMSWAAAVSKADRVCGVVK